MFESELSDTLESLRDALEIPLQESERAIQREKAWLIAMRRRLSGTDDLSPRQSRLVSAYSIGFISEIPGISRAGSGL